MAIIETCPYLPDEPVQVQVGSNEWAQGNLLHAEPNDSSLFGLVWRITVKLPNVTITTICDGDGWNHTINHGVRPGFADEILDELKAVAS